MRIHFYDKTYKGWLYLWREKEVVLAEVQINLTHQGIFNGNDVFFIKPRYIFRE